MSKNSYFQVGIRYEKIMENGMRKKVTEQYLVNALSFTEAEARAIEEMTPFIIGEFEVKTIKKANFSELFKSDDANRDKWFKCKLTFITIDEKSGAEKKTSTNVLVQASSSDDVIDCLNNEMKGTIADYEITSFSETNIIDVFEYQPKSEIND